MASGSFGGTVKLTGESEYQKALKGISSNLKVLNSELKVVTSQYDKNDNSSQKLRATNEVLNRKIEEQKNKINVLKTALAQSENETGKNSETTKKWQVQLNNAEAELNDMNKELKDQHGNLEKSGEKALKLGDIIKANLISEGIISGIKTLGKAISSVGSAFVNVGKQAIQSYSQYEQLVGGVDTLFGESSAKVIEYANNAYKTAGMSANQYLETVTSFSASLIQSLDGDTAKASEVANRAIIDMSDNANKMGTDISMIQNAYQGFAKQNYTMLDNLKLGYGGNKTEMERLIADASKMTDVQRELGITVDEGDMSFANIANAISVVQKNMGLMGTTSLEASDTIAGSTGSMKSAWQNLIAGIADDNADFETLVNNFVESIVGKDGKGGFLNNMLPRIEVALDGIVQLVVNLADKLLPKIAEIGANLITTLTNSISENMPALMESGEKILNTLIDGITNTLPKLIPCVVQIIETLVTTILENLPKIAEAGIEMLNALINGIAEMLPALVPAIIKCILKIVETILDNMDAIIDAGNNLLMGLIDGIMEALPLLIEKLPTIVQKFIEGIIRNLPKVFKCGGDVLTKLVDGIMDAIPQLIESAPQIIADLVDTLLTEGIPALFEVGGDLLAGLIEGLLDPEAIWNACVSLFKGIFNGICSLFGINSPSRVFKEQVGKNLALGVGEGFSDTMKDVTNEMANSIPTEFDTSVNMSTSSAHSSNYDYLITAFKEALKDTKVVMNNREMGAFVVETVEREVYA